MILLEEGIPLMPTQLKIFPEKCSGCKSCEIICSLMNEGEFNPSKSRITTLIFREDAYPLPYNFPSTCKQCADAPCIRACPVTAISRAKDKTKVIKIDEGLCITCGRCVEACPFGAMFFDGERNVPFKCELCGGEPACVSICSTGAIVFVNQRPFFSKPHALAATGFAILAKENKGSFLKAKAEKEKMK
ncbi:MAG: 4Fe-4S dicluster domain-containing protein [Desulfobacteraceae bacterium]|nr:4Fe-4S dicluster domain-containing protein [Desulfobacteraceae bacterium]